jgi:asparagine synthase (glutamine-hydrolysing)
MCGIAGFVNPSRGLTGPELQEFGLRMIATLHHRGPDDQGVWSEATSGVCLAHRRLAIQDLSVEGHQPMCSADGRYVLIFNGEIYNFQEIKFELEKTGETFRGHSDTEVMLSAFCEYGIHEALEKFIGMFAFALWDRQERCLYLARDRAGEKPLYYGWNRGVFLFGSELKALLAFPDFRADVDSQALSLYMRYSYIPAPHSIYKDIFKLSPGSILKVNEAQLKSHEAPIPEQYWSLWSAVERGLSHPFRGDEKAAIEHLTGLLKNSVRMQMVADVPIGGFLSGGVDSSVVVALMQAQSGRAIKTFSIGFTDAEYDEAPFAQAVANHLGTQHTEMYVHPGTLLEAIPLMAQIYDEPFADTSSIPTVLLSQLARKQVTVSLSGDGGDELFGGYSLYQKTELVWESMRRVPPPVRNRLAALLANAGTMGVEIQTRIWGEPRLFKRMFRLSELLRTAGDRQLYELLVAQCRNLREWLRESHVGLCLNDTITAWDALSELRSRMMYTDFLRYLPDDVLVKVDRAAMSASLETRIPLLDRRIIEFTWSLPLHFKKRHGLGKWLLRQVLYQFVPRKLVERPKQGFAAPVEDWIRKELRPWAEDLLSESQLKQDGYFLERNIRRKWNEHVSGKGDWGRPLWNVLMFQGWLEAQKAQKTSVPSIPALPNHRRVTVPNGSELIQTT